MAAQEPRPIQERLAGARAEAARFIRAQPRQRLVAWVVVPAAIGLLVAAAVWWSRNTGFELLYSDLELENSARIVDHLEKGLIRYRLLEDGHSILVPGGQVARVRMQLAEKGIVTTSLDPADFLSKGGPGTPVATQEMLRRQYLQAEVAQSIETLSSVRAARVHLTPREDSPFLSERVPSKASVVLELNPSSESGLFPRAIAFLVANAVEGLAIENVSIVDADGRQHWPESAEPMASGHSSLAELQREMEHRMAEKALALLGKVVGLANVTARASVELDADHVETAVESFEGEPRLRSEAVGAGTPGTTTRNYEVDRIVEHREVNVARVKRISLGVLVNESEDQGFTEADLDRFEQILRDAVGFDQQRGDSITVAAVRFVPVAPLAVAAPVAAPGIAALAAADPILLGGIGAAVLVLAAVTFLGGRKSGRSSALSRVEAEAPRFDRRAQAVTTLRRWIAEDPERVARLARGWKERDA